MTAWAILIGTEEKVGVLSPDIVGPFASIEAAREWAASPVVERWEKHQDGGWPSVIVVGDGCEAETPEEFTEAWGEEEELEALT